MAQTIDDLGRLVKAKHPGAYEDLADGEVGKRVQSKYPGAYDDFTAMPVSSPRPTLSLPGSTGPMPQDRPQTAPPVVRTTHVGDAQIELPPEQPASSAQPPPGIMNARMTGPAGPMNANISAQPDQKMPNLGLTVSPKPFQEGAIGRAFGLSSETPEARKEDPSTPLMRFEAATPQPGIGRAAAQFASGLTTPGNLAIMAATGGIGALETQLGKSAISKLISLGFSGQMIYDAAGQAPEVADAIGKGDWATARQHLTHMVLGAGMAALGIRHAASGRGAERVLQAEPATGGEAIPPAETQLAPQPQGPPTAAQPTVPESPATIHVQMTQLNQGKRAVVMFPKGTEVPVLPPDTPTHIDAHGNTYAYDPERIQPAAIDAAVASNQLPQILGAEGMGAPDKSMIQGEPITVVGRTMDGTTTQATVTDQANLQATIDATKKVTPPGGKVTVEPAENEIAARQEAGAPAPEPPPPIVEAPPPEPQPVAAATPPEPPPYIEPDTPSAIHQFLADETGTSSMRNLLGEDANKLIEQRQAALAELERAKNTPEEKDFGQKTLQWFTGERDLWGAQVNQIIESLRKVMPEFQDQEALSLMRDFKNRPGEMQAWVDGTHPKLAAMDANARLVARRNIERLRPSIERALNPSPEMLTADRVLTNLADVSLTEGKRVGFLDSSITPDEYVSHLLHPKDEAELSATPPGERTSKLGKIGRRFAFAEKRAYPTLIDAVADNVKPRTLNAFDAFTIHGDKFATARATNMLVQALKDSGIGKWAGHAGTAPGGVPMTNIAGAPGVPADWVEIAPHAHPFQNVISYLDKEGEPASARQTLFVPKSIEAALRPITDPDYTSKVKGFTKLRMFQAYTKAAQLGLSLFHVTTENYMAMANMGFKGWARGLRAERDSPAFRSQEREFILHGGTTPVQGKTYEAYKSLQPGSIPSWGDIWQKLPAVKQMDQAARAVTELTFGKVQRQFKVTDYAMHKAAWIADHPNATPAEQTAAMRSIAKEVNAVYGGLHWENLGINRMSLNIARAIMLAPDWTFSNLANLKYATERGTPAGKMARAFWVRTTVGGIAATQALSLMLSGKPSKRLSQVYLGKDKDGQEIYQNVFFKGAPGDMVNLVNNVGDYGAVMGLSKSMMGKAAPVLRTGLQLGTNRNYLGQTIVPKGMNPVAGTARGIAAATQGLSPVPFSIQNMKDMLIGPNADRYTMPEYFTTLFAGTPPQHLPPAGMKMTKKGLRVKQEKPQGSVWQQFSTGKLSAPGPVNP